MRARSLLGGVVFDRALASRPRDWDAFGAAGLIIGGSNLPGNHVNATIDEAAVHDKALTLARLTAHYQAGIWPGVIRSPHLPSP